MVVKKSRRASRTIVDHGVRFVSGDDLVSASPPSTATSGARWAEKMRSSASELPDATKDRSSERGRRKEVAAVLSEDVIAATRLYWAAHRIGASIAYAVDSAESTRDAASECASMIDGARDEAERKFFTRAAQALFARSCEMSEFDWWSRRRGGERKKAATTRWIMDCVLTLSVHGRAATTAQRRLAVVAIRALDDDAVGVVIVEWLECLDR